jgi:hypothetical protein
MNPKSMALAYRIWCYANPLGWDCTAAEIADDLREPVQRVQRICSHRGWNRKLRTVRRADGANNSYGAFGFSDTASAAINRYRRLAEEPSE